MRILVTGGAGFIGANFVAHLLQSRPEVMRVGVFDALTYAGNLHNLLNFQSNPRFTFIHGRIEVPADVERALTVTEWDVVVNFAAESHVDRSIASSSAFIQTNVVGVQVLLDGILVHAPKLQKFISISTDEVYGSLGQEGQFFETTPIAPRSPYSASKAAGDGLVMAYFHTHQLNTITLRCSNNYGPFQFPEKLIPLMITNAIQDKPLPVYGDGANIRDWIHVSDFCRGIWAAIEKGAPGNVYHFGGASERTNLEVVHQILRALGKPESLIAYVTDRKGHDFRYSVNFDKSTRELGWRPDIRFEDGLSATMDWYLAHPEWWTAIFDGSYQKENPNPVEMNR